MERVHSLLGSNPFHTQAGQRIEKATDPSLSSENWALNMEICDYINAFEEGGKDAIKAIKKRFNTNGKHTRCMLYTLTVLETCVKNCGRRFHLLVANKDFLQDMVKLIGPKNEPSELLQQKVLQLIQTWAEAFCGIIELREIDKVYRELKAKGVDFPIADFDSGSKNIIDDKPASNPIQQQQQQLRNQQYMQHQPMQSRSGSCGSGIVTLSNEEITIKVKKDLEIVTHHITMFNELITGIQPGQATEDDNKLMEDLNGTCHKMQQRIVDLIGQITIEDLTVELLHMNDEMNNLFMRYDRYKRMAVGSNQNDVPLLNPNQADNTGLLVDLGDSTTANTSTRNTNNLPPLNNQFSGLSLQGNQRGMATNGATSSSGGQYDEFDILAKSRQIPEAGPINTASVYAGASGVSAPKPAPNLIDTENDFVEMEKWLKENPDASGQNQLQASSSEFDQFLASRAKENNIQTITASTGGSSQEKADDKNDKKNEKLFAL